MRLVITGATVTDHVPACPGRFVEHVSSERPDRVSLPHLVAGQAAVGA